MKTLSLYSRLARLLEYPQDDYQDVLKETVSSTKSHDLMESDAMKVFEEHFNQFASAMRPMTLDQIQELYTQTFDINPICTLEVGWHLYGEAYERGAFLVKMRELLRTNNIEEATELPDHLTYMLRLMNVEDIDGGEVLIGRYALPAIEKILKGFEGHTNPFELLLKAINSVLSDFHLQKSGV